MPTTTIFVLVPIIGAFATLALVLALAERQTAHAPAEPFAPRRRRPF